MKSIKIFLLKTAYSVVTVFLVYCYFYEMTRSDSSPAGIMSLSSLVAAIFVLLKAADASSRGVYNLSRNGLLRNIYTDTSFIILAVSPVCVLVHNPADVRHIMYAVLNTGQILFTVAVIATVHAHFAANHKLTALACIPAVLFFLMVLSDKIPVPHLVIFNPAGSLFYGLLGLAFSNIVSAVVYLTVFLSSVFFLFYPARIKN